MKAILVVLGLICYVSAHGRFSSPPYRGLFQKDWYTYMDNAPTKDASGNNSPNVPEFVCRKNNAMPAANYTTITAGSNLNIQMTFEAAHVGDCFLYLTYDADKPETDMKWFKIWQQHECKDYNQVNVPVKIPDYLPSSSHAILRWEWYALHVYPEIEFYAQCADVKVNGITNGVLGTPMVSIPGNLPPAKAADGTSNYRDPYNQHDGKMQEFFTGPALAVAGGPYTPGTASSGSSDKLITSPASVVSTSVAVVFAMLFAVVLL